MCEQWTHIIWIYREYFAIKMLFKFRLLGLDFCFYIWPRIKIDTTANQPCTLIHVRQTHELNHHIYLLHVYCVSRNIDFFSQTFYAYILTIFFASFATRRDHPSILWGTKCSKIKIYDNKRYDIYADYISYIHACVDTRNHHNRAKFNEFIY